MNRQKRFVITGLAVGAAAVAGWFGFQAARPQPIAGEMKAAAFAVSAEETTVPAPATTTHEPPQHNPDLDNAKQLLEDGKKFEARAALTKLILPAPDGPARDEMRKMLDAINKELFFSSKPSPDSVNYEVQAGDTLSVIVHNQTKDSNQSKDYYFTEVVMLVNGIKDARRIRPGKVLKIPQGTFSALVQKDAHRLIILLDGELHQGVPGRAGRAGFAHAGGQVRAGRRQGEGPGLDRFRTASSISSATRRTSWARAGCRSTIPRAITAWASTARRTRRPSARTCPTAASAC